MIDITFNPLLEALGWTLLHSLWQGLVVCLLIGILLRQLKGHEANLRYFVSLLGLFIIVFWSALTFKSYYLVQNGIAQELTDTFQFNFNGISDLEITNTWQSIIHSLNASLEVIMPWFMIFWVGGLLLFSIKNILGISELRRLRRSGQSPMRDSFYQQLELLRDQLGLRVPVQLFESTLVNTPLVIGVFKPLILFPVGLVNGLSSQQVEAILLHELAHIKRQDYLVNLIQIILETIFFFNPAVWYISSKIREERENCCDDIAIENQSDPMEYAKALTLIGSMQNYELAMGISGRGNKLYSRIKRMFNPIKRTTMKDKLITMLILGITLLSLTIYTIKSYSSFNNNLITEFGETPSNILKAETSGALMTPAVITLLESVKSKDLIIDDGDDDPKKKKKKKSSKTELKKELKAKEDKIRALEAELAQKEARDSRDRSRMERDNLRNERDESREIIDNTRKERDLARKHRAERQNEGDQYKHYEVEMRANSEERKQIREELEKEMEALRDELEDAGISGSFHINSFTGDDDLMESISDILDIVSDQMDLIPKISIYFDEEMEEELEKLHKDLELHELEIEEAIHHATKIIELKAHNIEEQVSKLELDVHEMEKSIKEFEVILKKELVKDGLINNVKKEIEFHISNDKVSLNGKEISKELQEKYMNLWNEFYDSKDFDFHFHLDDE